MAQFNIWSKNRQEFMLGSNLPTIELAKEWLVKLTNRLIEVNKGRVANGYPAIPLDDYEIKETDIDWHLDIPEHVLVNLAKLTKH